jgi:arylsulfatase A-like enzyme
MTSRTRPNVVVILTDDTGYGDPPCYNPDSRDPMPRVDALAREGVRFTDAHSASALCTPSRYALLTGRYHWRTPRERVLVMPYDPPIVEPWRPTLPRLLGQAGYGTACIGKWHLGFRYPRRGPGDAFTTVESETDFTRPLEGGPCDVGFDTFFGTAGCSTSDAPYGFIEDRHTVGVPSVPSDEALHALPGFFPGLMTEDFDLERVDARHVDAAIAFVDRHRASRPDDPIFLYVALSAPHNPWLPPDFTRGASAEGPRGDMNALVDWCVGRIVDALDERGLRDDTLLIFTSDHGPMRGANGHASAGALRGLKNTVFEGGHRVPFIARWPGRIPAGTTSDELVCLADLYATVADLLGLDVGEDAAEDSFSILPALGGDRQDRARGAAPLRPHLVSDAGGLDGGPGDVAVRQGHWKLVLLARDADGALAARREPVADAHEGTLLFDLQADPGERRNLAAERPRTVAQLRGLLDRLRARGARFLEADDAPAGRG